MRLIDKDALLTKVDKEWGLWVEVVNVKYAPEVEAIPIEWIENYVADHWKTTKLYATDYVWKMLEDWEKENETDR